MLSKYFTCITFLFFSFCSLAQVKTPFSSGEIYQRLEQLNTVGSALYIAAHPDDENTQLISYLVNGMHIRTAYLAATRGDGGQNLVGPEIREKLGLIRTQELLAARGVDGGYQYFSRANDFGYSKHPDETFTMWDKEKVLADFVWAIRKFRPDILITRFNTEAGTTHGHHTASAVLAKEAFELAGDPTAFREQLKYVEVWQPSKIFWNTSRWFLSRGEEFNEDDHAKVNVGAFNQYLGESYTEISSRSRSMHKSQGFGSSGSRGENFEYFEQWGGEESNTLFGGIDITWSRIEGANQVAYLLREALSNFESDNPATILPELLAARKQLLGLRDQYWKEVKLVELEELILSVTGTYIELTADDFLYTDGDSIEIELEVINRSRADMKLSSVKYSISQDQVIYNMDLNENQRIILDSSFKIPSNLSVSHPYWLEEKDSKGMYTVPDQLLIGLPENPPLINGLVTIKVDDQFISFDLPVVFKRTDPVNGETYRPVELAPKVMVSLPDKAIVFGDQNSKPIQVRVTAGQDNLTGSVQLDLPEGWSSNPESVSFALETKGAEQIAQFDIIPPSKSSTGIITAIAKMDGKEYNKGITTIEYDHIPTQTLFPKAEAKVVKLDVKKVSNKIGYIMGAGDEVPSLLEQIGYEVQLLEKDQVDPVFLAQFDAVIVGVRAYNTVSWLSFKNKDLFEYVSNGGNLVVQYNTSQRLVTDDLAPYKLNLSRDRVTVEEAPVSFVSPNHEVLNFPNKITQNDFDGWVQERGLYFPDEWSQEFSPILSLNDPGEEPKTGSLLVAKYGKGYYCYSGLSFFRELPAGVPGAYRLLVNMISLGKNN